MTVASRIPDLDSFFAYSIALEEEAAERHDELADMLEVHNNDEVAAIFRKLAHYSRLHAAEVRELAGDPALLWLPSAQSEQLPLAAACTAAC